MRTSGIFWLLEKMGNHGIKNFFIVFPEKGRV